MADTNLIFGAAIAGDVLSAFQLPGGNTLVSLAEAFVAKRRKEAADILIEEISKGGHDGQITFDKHDVDPLIETILRFSKAVEDGAARDNLRLLAQVIAGLKKNKALAGDSFRRWASILEHLTRDELILVGRAYVIQKRIADAGPTAENTFWQYLENEMRSGHYSSGEISAIAASVSRTGLLTPASGFGSMVYMPTPWLRELGSLAEIGWLAGMQRS